MIIFYVFTAILRKINLLNFATFESVLLSFFGRQLLFECLKMPIYII